MSQNTDTTTHGVTLTDGAVAAPPPAGTGERTGLRLRVAVRPGGCGLSYQLASTTALDGDQVRDFDGRGRGGRQRRASGWRDHRARRRARRQGHDRQPRAGGGGCCGRPCDRDPAYGRGSQPPGGPQGALIAR